MMVALNIDLVVMAECVHCATMFPPKRATQTFCSRECYLVVNRARAAVNAAKVQQQDFRFSLPGDGGSAPKAHVGTPREDNGLMPWRAIADRTGYSPTLTRKLCASAMKKIAKRAPWLAALLEQDPAWPGVRALGGRGRRGTS